MDRNMNKILLASLLVIVSMASSANDKLNYNYAQFGLIHSAGELTGDKSGYNFDISLDWTDSVYVRTIYNTQSADVWASGLKADVDATEFSLSLGYHAAITRSTDFFGEIGFINQDASGVIPQTTYGNDEDGFQGKLGIRSRWSANWEYSVFAGYRDVDLSSYVDEARYEDDDTIYGAELRYYLGTNLSLGLTVGEEATGETAQLNLRFNL